jgi:hypothetical protein
VRGDKVDEEITKEERKKEKVEAAQLVEKANQVLAKWHEESLSENSHVALTISNLENLNPKNAKQQYDEITYLLELLRERADNDWHHEEKTHMDMDQVFKDHENFVELTDSFKSAYDKNMGEWKELLKIKDLQIKLLGDALKKYYEYSFPLKVKKEAVEVNEEEEQDAENKE